MGIGVFQQCKLADSRFWEHFERLYRWNHYMARYKKEWNLSMETSAGSALPVPSPIECVISCRSLVNFSGVEFSSCNQTCHMYQSKQVTLPWTLKHNKKFEGKVQFIPKTCTRPGRALYCTKTIITRQMSHTMLRWFQQGFRYGQSKYSVLQDNKIRMVRKSNWHPP